MPLFKPRPPTLKIWWIQISVKRSMSLSSFKTQTFLCSKSKCSSQSTNLSSLSPETVSSASYLAIYERRKTIKQATVCAKQAQERSHRKFKLLEKWFELEKHRIVNEVMEAENKAALAKLETISTVYCLTKQPIHPLKWTKIVPINITFMIE